MEKALPNQLQAWLMALRMPTLMIPTIQVATGTAVAFTYAEHVNWLIAFYAWLVAVCITIGTNLINDVIDFQNEGDVNASLGRIKVIRAGFLTKRQVYMGGMLAFAIACVIPLALPVDQWTCFAIVLVSAICGYCYTGGPYPISYLGLSEIFVFIFYGGVCVTVPFYAQTYFINPAILLGAVQMGMLAILPNALNNYRDINEDMLVNKRTLAVRFGKEFAKREIALLIILPFVLNVFWLFLGLAEAMLIPFMLIPMAVFFVRTIWNLEPSQVRKRYFALSILIHFSFGVLLIIGLLLG